MKFTLPQIAIGITAIILAVFLTYTFTQRSSSSSRKEIENKLKESEKREKLMEDTLKLRDQEKKNLIALRFKYQDSTEIYKLKAKRIQTIIRYIHPENYSNKELDSLFKKRYPDLYATH